MNLLPARVKNKISSLLFGVSVPPAQTLVMNPELIEGYNATRPVLQHGSVCFAPSVNMVFTQNGDVKVCCHNGTYVTGTWPGQTISQIWKSQKAEELRGYMRQYDLMHGCEVCEFDIKRKNFTATPANHFDTIPLNTAYPTMMEFALTNICNLECVMCIGDYSSLIRKNREKLPPLQSPYNSEFLKQVEEFIPHLKETRFSSSGEAFSVDMNYELWEMLIRLNPLCLIMVQSNGTILTERVKKILEQGNFKIGISLDSLQKETYESIRINANFDKVMANVRWFSEYATRKKSHFSLALCVMRQNWREMPAFVNFCNDLNAAAVFHKVWEPGTCTLNNLPAAELETIYSYLHGFEFPENTILQKKNKRHYFDFVSIIQGWWKEAAEREKNMADISAMPVPELTAIVAGKIETQIQKLRLTGAEKKQLTESSVAKFETMMQRFAPHEQKAVLQMLYFVTPERMIEPLRQNTAEMLYEITRKSLARENAVTVKGTP
jgi:MoaA/NifB/PqqE/SkfB family radical SAM enzyme